LLKEKDKFILSDKDTYTLLASPTGFGEYSGKTG
jgi:hypothetical protein